MSLHWIALPPFSGFWGLLKLTDSLWPAHPFLVAAIIVVNALTAFSLTRFFGLVFGGRPKEMSERSPEVFWLMSLPMVALTVFTLLSPFVLQRWELLPSWGILDKDMALLLIWSSGFGLALGSFVYIGNTWQKPITLPWKQLQDFLSYDFYIQRIYQLTIVNLVSSSSKLITWCDRYIVDGAVNAVGFVTLFSGQALKYTASGQLQLYVLLIVSGIVFLAFLGTSAIF